MADPELLETLRRGPEAWNRYRDEGSDRETPDLSRADLSGLDLREADLHGANLTGANLSEAKLEGAILTDGQLAQVEARAANFAAVPRLRRGLHPPDRRARQKPPA